MFHSLQYRYRNLVLINIVYLLITSSSSAQISERYGYWNELSIKETQISDRKLSMPDKFVSYQLNLSKLKSVLANAPLEDLTSSRNIVKSVIIELPLADGSSGEFEVWESPIMEETLANT